MRNFIKNLIVSFVIVFSFLLSACDSKITIAKTKRPAAQVSTATNETVEAVRELESDIIR